MKNIFFFILFLTTIKVSAQDDPMDILNNNTKPTTTVATATFKSTRVINGQSVETIAKKHLDFRISHRFGALNTGAYNYFGLDQATMRMGFEYGITNDLMIGIGRSSTQKTFDYFGKYKLLKQSSGAKTMPVSVTLFASLAAVSLSSNAENSASSPLFDNNIERWTYCSQLLIARKFSDDFSLQISPTYLHRNKVFRINSSDGSEILEPNDIFAIGLGGRYKINKRTSINAEYFYRLPSLNSQYALNANYHNSLSVGVDIETGGHVFQLHFTNSLGMIEKQFIAENTEKWTNGGIHWGFNLSRTFSFDREKKKKTW
ncbi:DUF5777 family beta-barrel protein [Emticicia sp. SJ17W-69]|uniref:DUF5777 family beta-barrel protein n=1 Tax=Emticicia sp. SJ17W-69 TaxID=3421657 RepID=UPI003EB887D7